MKEILHIVHNPINLDARVRKYSRSLGIFGEGYLVHLLGIKSAKNQEKVPFDEGQTTFELLDLYRARNNFIKAYKNIFGFILLIFSAITLFFIATFLFGYENLVKNTEDFFLLISGWINSLSSGWINPYIELIRSTFANLQSSLTNFDQINLLTFHLMNTFLILGILFFITRGWKRMRYISLLVWGMYIYFLPQLIFYYPGFENVDAKIISQFDFAFQTTYFLILIALFSIFFLKSSFNFLKRSFRFSVRQFRKFKNSILNNNFLKQYLVPTKVFSFLCIHSLISNQLKNYDKDKLKIIHVHDHIALLPVLLNMRKFKNTKLIWDAHELYITPETSGVFFSRIIRFTLWKFQKKIDHVFTVNESFKKIYQEKYPQLKKIDVVMNAADFEIPKRRRKSNKIKELLDLPKTKKIILFQGGLAPNRGIEELLKASSGLKKDWVIVFMGNGRLSKNIEQKIIEQKDSEHKNVFHIPPVTQRELFHWTSSATIGIIPYLNTSLNHLYCTPNKLWEFTCSKIPFIATDLEEMGQFVRKNKVGWLLPRDFHAKDIIYLVNSLKENEIKKKVTQTNKILKIENWKKYEKVFRKEYSKMLLNQ